MSRRVILVLAGYYLPGYKAGGPVRSISNLVDALGDLFDFRIVAYDRDLGDEHPYDSAVYGSWQPADKAHVWWIKPGKSASIEVRQSIESSKPDLLYLNSFFDPVFGFGSLSFGKNPILCAPRGQFGEGAMRLGSFKKRTLIRLLSATGKLRSLSWQATDDSEVQDILNAVPQTHREKIYLAPNLAKSPAANAPNPSSKHPGCLNICFLSRISPKKNLEGAIRIVSKLKGKIAFNVYGPLEDETYGARCLSALKELPNNIEATYRGPLSPEEVNKALAANDVLLLPTFGENFGHAIYEALSAGLPVVIGDATPWRNLASDKAGADLPTDAEDRFVTAAQSFVDMGADEFSDWTRGARLRARSYFENSDALGAHKAMFTALLGPKP